MSNILDAATAHLASLPLHLKTRYSAELIRKMVYEIIKLRIEVDQQHKDMSSPGSSNRLINGEAERQSPASDRDEAMPPDVSQPDNGLAAGGRGPNICQRLRRWCIATDAESAQDLMDEAADEIERLRITADEREAIEWYAGYGRDGLHAATLRKLLGRTNHDAAPEAIARTDPSESSVPLGNGGGCGGTDKPVTLPAVGTGNTTLDGAPAAEAGAGKPQISHPQAGNTQTAPPCVETDGPPSKGEGFHIPDSRTRLSEAEIGALEYVVEEGRIASMDDYGVLRSLLVRVRPEWESQSYEKNDEKRINTAMDRDTTPGDGSVQGEGTLTDEEREALEFAVETGRVATHDAATLRNLLERLT